MDVVPPEKGSLTDLWGKDIISTHVASSCTASFIVSSITEQFGLWDVQQLTGSLQQLFPTRLALANVTAPYAAIQVIVTKEQPSEELSLKVSDQIAYIRARLTLSVSEIGKIFDVDRQAVYGWIKEAYKPDNEKTSKLEALYYVAKLSTHFVNNASHDLCHQAIGTKGSLMDLFLKSEIDIDQAKEILKALPATQREQRRAKIRRSSIRDALRRHGLDDSPTQSGIDEVDLRSGKIKDK